MPTELTGDAYEDVRKFIDPTRADPPNWDYLALYDSNDTEVLRTQISTDSRLSWTHTAGDQTLVLEGTFAGSDADVSHGTTFSAAGLFAESGIGNGNHRTKDPFNAVAIEDDTDALDLIHEVEIPQV